MVTFSEASAGNKDTGAKIFKTNGAQCHTVEQGAGHKQGNEGSCAQPAEESSEAKSEQQHRSSQKQQRKAEEWRCVSESNQAFLWFRTKFVASESLSSGRSSLQKTLLNPNVVNDQDFSDCQFRSFDQIQIEELCVAPTSVARRVTKNAPDIAESSDQPLSLCKTKLQIVSAAEYKAQKVWWKKCDPFFLLSPAQQVVVAAAAVRSTRVVEASRSGAEPSTSAADPQVEEEQAEEEDEATEDERLLKTSVSLLDLS
uniref:Uncharacterized protein n=1 Tax=Chenopodium quinoa TaxID=63459 RepID=A0A803L771_CHEQI